MCPCSKENSFELPRNHDCCTLLDRYVGLTGGSFKFALFLSLFCCFPIGFSKVLELIKIETRIKLVPKTDPAWRVSIRETKLPPKSLNV